MSCTCSSIWKFSFESPESLFHPCLADATAPTHDSHPQIWSLWLQWLFSAERKTLGHSFPYHPFTILSPLPPTMLTYPLKEWYTCLFEDLAVKWHILIFLTQLQALNVYIFDYTILKAKLTEILVKTAFVIKWKRSLFSQNEFMLLGLNKSMNIF